MVTLFHDGTAGPKDYNMTFAWTPGVGRKRKKLPNSMFAIGASEFGNKTCDYGVKCLWIKFHFQRRLTLSLITIYFPSALIVHISFVSFWIDAQSVPGRVALVITSLLTLMTQLLNVRNGLPPISYVTALDVWFFVCVSYISAVLFEFAIAYNLARKVRPLARQSRQSTNARYLVSAASEKLMMTCPIRLASNCRKCVCRLDSSTRACSRDRTRSSRAAPGRRLSTLTWIASAVSLSRSLSSSSTSHTGTISCSYNSRRRLLYRLMLYKIAITRDEFLRRGRQARIVSRATINLGTHLGA